MKADRDMINKITSTKLAKFTTSPLLAGGEKKLSSLTLHLIQHSPKLR